MIQFQNVSVTIQGNKILDNINLTVNDGEFVLLCGESGCGKTTLTRLVNGLIPHFVKGVKVDGAVTVEALDIAESPMYKIAESVGSVFQNPKTQFFNTNSSAEIAFGLENIGADLDFMHKRVAKTISDLEIETLADRSVFSLSGGEKQLLAFASVYAMNPQVYVLDEPSANLDHEAMGKLHKILETVNKGGHTVLIAEHRLSYLYGLADRIVYLKAGCIERVFTAAEFVGLSESERIAMGLRSICSEKISIPERTFMQLDSPLAVCHLSVKRKKQPTLNEIVFFHVGAAVEKLRAQAKKDGKPLFAIDAINLLESGMGNGCDVTVGILAPKPVRLARIMARDHLSEQAARARIDAQKPDEFYRTGCQVILTNDTSLEAFRDASRRLLNDITKEETP